MRFFAGDHFPRLAVQSGDLPRPWVMPSWAPRTHRNRLAALLAQALRALEPGITLIELRWAERHYLLSGRLILPSAALVWWRINAVPVIDPAAVVLDGSRLTPGLPIYDFDARTTIPAEAWLGPLKMRVLHGVQDRLFDERPVAAYEEISDAISELASLFVSPVDLVIAVEAMIDVAAQGGNLASARAEALAQVIAARFARGTADGPVKALVATSQNKALNDKGRAVLHKAGLVDAEGVTPLLEVVADEEVLRRTVLRIAGRRRLKGSLADLAPGVLPEAEAMPLTQPQFVFSVPRRPGKIGVRPTAMPEPSSATVLEAWGIAQRDDIEGAARVILRALQQREDSGWTKEDLQIAGSLLVRAAQSQDDRLGDRLERSALLSIAALCEAAGDLLERAGLIKQAAYILQEAGRRKFLAVQLPSAGKLYERAYQLAVGIGDKFGQVKGLISLSRLRRISGDQREALICAEQAAALSREISAYEHEAVAMNAVGEIGMRLRDYERAEEAFKVALSAIEKTSDVNLKCLVLTSMGELAQAKGDYRAARSSFEEALPLARAQKQRLAEAVLHLLLGDLSVQRKEPLRAREEFEEAAAIYHELGDVRNEAMVLERLGDARAAMNEMALAREAYDAALALAREAGDQDAESSVLSKLAPS